MKCTLESTSTKHCRFISATPVHTFTDADLAESYTDPHIKTTKNSSEMICIGFASHMRRKANHRKTFQENTSTESFGQTLKKYCLSYH